MDQDNRKIIDSFLAEIGSAVGKNIRLNENGISAFTYEHLTFVVEVPDNVTTFFVYTTLMALTQCTNPEVIMRQLLQLNYLQQETRGGCIALDSMNGDIIFSYSDRINEINSTEFRNILENFIDTALSLYKQIQEADVNVMPNDADKSFQSNMMMAGGGPKISSSVDEALQSKVKNKPPSLNDSATKPKLPNMASGAATAAKPSSEPTAKKKTLEPLKVGTLNPQNSIMP